jgi:hypothetical protein
MEFEILTMRELSAQLLHGDCPSHYQRHNQSSFKACYEIPLTFRRRLLQFEHACSVLVRLTLGCADLTVGGALALSRSRFLSGAISRNWLIASQLRAV